MIYEVKCTYCLSLLKNIKKYASANYLMTGGECYIEVDDPIDKALIEKIEYHQSNTYWYYNRLTERS